MSAGEFLSLNADDKAALSYVSNATGLSRTGLMRKLLWAYARGRIDVRDLPPLPEPYDATKTVARAPKRRKAEDA